MNELLTPPTVLASSGELGAFSAVGADDTTPRRESRRREVFGYIFCFFYENVCTGREEGVWMRDGLAVLATTDPKTFVIVSTSDMLRDRFLHSGSFSS